MNYKEIETEEDIKELMEEFCYFHDSCIKEMNYVSGCYVDVNRAMQPINVNRTVEIIFQSQMSDCRTIQVQFDKIKKLNLEPRDEEYDAIIYGASLIKVNMAFYWSEWENLKTEDINSSRGTWIAAERIRWKKLNDSDIY